MHVKEGTIRSSWSTIRGPGAALGAGVVAAHEQRLGGQSPYLPGGAGRAWIKVYRLAPNNQWEDLRPRRGIPRQRPIANSRSGECPSMPPTAWDGQPYRVELWSGGQMRASEGNIFAGQPAFRIMPGATCTHRGLVEVWGNAAGD